MSEDAPQGFFGVRRSNDGETMCFMLGFDRNQVVDWLKNQETASVDETTVFDSSRANVHAQVTDTGDKIVAAKELTERFLKAMSSIRSATFYASALGPILEKRDIATKLVPYAETNFQKEKLNDSTDLYCFRMMMLPNFKHMIDDCIGRKNGLANLPAAMLLSLVATFDSYLSEIVKFFLLAHPERYTGSDREISLKKVFAMSKLEDVIESIVDDDIRSLMRGSHTDQVIFVENNFSVQIRKDYTR
jgi:hypothetical protein